MKHWDKYDLGGVFDVFDFDKKMALINLDMIYEYAVKLDTIVTEESQLEEWVKMKLTRIEQNVSDVAHSLEGWEKFDEGGMIFKKQLLSISKYAHKLIEMIKGGSKLMSWQENKLAISANDIDNLYHHLDYKVGNRASQNKFATGGMMKYPDLSNETPIVINEPNNQKISEIDIALIDIALVRQDLGIEKTKIGSSNDAYQIFKQLWNKDSINVREEMNVLFLNNANEPIGYYEHTKGAINSTLVDVEMIGALALKTLSKGVILAHNHPSGNNKPSEADIKLYQQVKTALKMFNVTVLDSMILVPNSDNYYSLADNGYEMGGMVLSNKEIIKNIDFSDNTDRRLGRYDFSFETEDSEGASILDYDGYIIEAPSSSRMNDEIEWGQNVPEDWENAEKYILDEFYNWKLKRFKNGGGVGVYRIVEGYDHYKGMPLYNVIGDNDYIGEYHTDRKDAEKELQELIGGIGEYKVGDTFIGTPNAKYDASWQLHNPSTSYVINNKTNEILSIHKTPYEAIEKRDSMNPNFKLHFEIHSKEYSKGGKINSGREAMFKSQEPHEQRYKRKREWKEYKKEGWFGDWYEMGGGVGSMAGIKQNEGKLFNEKGEMLVYKKQSDTSSIYDVDVYEPRKTDVEEYSKFKYCKREKNGRECVYRLDKKALIEMIKKEKFIYSNGGGVGEIIALTLNNGNDYAIVEKLSKVGDAKIVWLMNLSIVSKHKVGDIINLRFEGDDYYSDWKKFDNNLAFKNFATEKQKKDFYELRDKYSKGGKINSGREAMFKSQEPHEQRYKRKREWKEYKKEGWFGDWYEMGGGVDDKKLYEIVFEDVFSFAIAKREANLTNSQYNKALQQIKDKTIVVDRFNKSSGVHEQLRIKEIKPIFAKGGGVGDKITIGSEIVGSKKMYFIYNMESGKKSQYFNSKEEAEKELSYLLGLKYVTTLKGFRYAKGGGIEVVGKGNKGAFRKREYDGMSENDVIGFWESRGYKISKTKSEGKLKPYTFYINKYANGGGVSSELSEPQKEFSKSAEMLVRENLQNGEICMCKLKKILGHEPNYPKQVIGSLVLEKAYLRNYYKI